MNAPGTYTVIYQNQLIGQKITHKGHPIGTYLWAPITRRWYEQTSSVKFEVIEFDNLPAETKTLALLLNL